MRDVLTERQRTPNRRTIVHWFTVVLLSVSGLLTAVTSIYFLILPSGRYEGGANPHYGQTFLFDRVIWSDIHTWAGMVLIAVSLFHIFLHWQWVTEMAKRTLAVVTGKRKPFNRKIWARVAVVSVIGLVFLGAAASGIYFFVLPGGQGASKTVQFLLPRSSWDLIHTWTGIVMIVAALVHFVMRWKWVARVTPAVGRLVIKPGVGSRPSLGRTFLAQEERLREEGSL
jgi:hypothetical protein